MRYTDEQAKEIESTLPDGFSVELSLDREYFTLNCSGAKLIADSANEDLYDPETAEAAFTEAIENIPHKARFIAILKAAIEKGFHVSPNMDLIDMESDAEAYIIKETPIAERDCEVIADFWKNRHYLQYVDRKGVTCLEEWGDIIGEDYKSWSYYRKTAEGKLVPAKWYESDDPDVFVYLDTVVTSAGTVITLIA